MVVMCDGCFSAISAEDIQFFSALGHVMRYCATCADVWKEFEHAQNCEAARYQRLLELWQQETRANLPLKLTPLDLPTLLTDAKGTALTLG